MAILCQLLLSIIYENAPKFNVLFRQDISRKFVQLRRRHIKNYILLLKMPRSDVRNGAFYHASAC